MIARNLYWFPSMRLTRQFWITLITLLSLTAPVLAQSTAAEDSAHWQATKADLNTIAGDRSAPGYSKNAQARIRARDSLHAIRKVVPPSAPTIASIAITPNGGSLGIGGTLQLTARALDSAGNQVVAPINWASSSNAVASVSASGLVTALSAGSALITASTPTNSNASRFVTVTVAANPPPDSTPTQPPPTTAGFDGPAELPRLTPARATPPCATSIPITQGMDLQQAINMAAPGTCLLLQPGTTFVGSFVLPNKGANSAWITIATQAALPSAGTRMTPTAAASLKLAKVLIDRYAAAITVAQGANHYRIRGVEIGVTPAAQATGVNMLVDIRNLNAKFSPTTGPSFIQIEQAYIHGTPTQGIRRCIWQDGYMNATYDSWVADCHENGTDTQAGLHGAGARGIVWDNNHLEAGHEILMFGGFDAADSTLQPSDITIRRNHIYRPPQWKGVWQTKNLVESKNARRMLFEGNVMENSWPDAQAGFMMLFKSENQNGGAPWTTTSDVVVRYNIIRNGANGFNISATGSNGTPAVHSANYSIHDNLIDSVGKLGGAGIAMQSLGDLTRVEYRQNTFLNGLQGNSSNQAISFDGAPAIRLVWDGNIIGHGAYGVKGTGTPEGTATLDKFAPGAVFTRNVIVGGGSCTQYPSGTTCPATAPAPTITVGGNMTLLNQLTAGVAIADPLALRRSVPRRNQLRHAIPATKLGCQKPIPRVVCQDPPMGLD